MFNDSKYTKIYYQIIDRAFNRDKIEGYTERHHIIPKCVGGTDEPSNLIRLTAREHFVCHLLLPKMHTSNKLKFALVMLTVSNQHHTNRYVPNSRIYEIVKKINVEASSVRSKGKAKHNVGKKKYYNPKTGEEKLLFDQIEGWLPGSPKLSKSLTGIHKNKKYYYNPETMEVINIKENSTPPEGWVKGNPNAATNTGVFGKVLSHCPSTGKTYKGYTVPEGYALGDPNVWIHDGINSKRFNVGFFGIPEGWQMGRLGGEKRSIAKKNNSEKKVMTPLGEYKHPLRFCEAYNCGISIFDNFDTKLKNRGKSAVLISELKKIGYDFSKTKRENGFYFL